MNKREILTSDDFYTYFKPFSIWLVKKKQIKFESLSSKSSRKYFDKFIRKWNSNSLSSIFYDIDSLLQKYSHLIKTNHQWNFKLSSKDSNLLNETLTQVEDLNKFSLETEMNKIKFLNPKDTNENNKDINKRIIGPALPFEFSKEKEEKGQKRDIFNNPNEKILTKESIHEAKVSEIKFLKRKEKKEALELSPKKIGKEAVIERKKALNKKLNGEKDDDFEAESYVNENGESFANAKKRELIRNERKAMKFQEKREKINEKLIKFQESEDLKVKNLIESLGLQNKYKI